MAYTPLKTWADGDLILAADVQGEFDNVREYLRRIETAAIETSKWVDTKHIMRGNYDAVSNVAHNCSGIFGGIASPPEEKYTYVSCYNTLRIGTTIWEYVPQTSFTLEVRRPMTVFFNWWATAACKANDDGVSQYADIAMFVGNKTLPNSECRTRLIEESLATTTYRETRPHVSGFYMADFNSVGTYNIGLVGQGTAAKTYLTAWGLTCEAFYI